MVRLWYSVILFRFAIFFVEYRHRKRLIFQQLYFSKQLLHVSSGKYLTVIPDSLADDERDNIKVGLNVGGNPLSWFQVSPRYKIDKDGDRVMTNAEVYLKVAERGNEYIHLAERDPKPGYQREINCALEFTSWRLQIFQGSAFALDTKKILISQLVYLHDPESKCNLTIAETKVESLDGVQKDIEESEYFHEYGDIILTPGQEDIDSNLLWFIESSSMVKGGPIKCKSDQIRFKHLNSGMYLQQVSVVETIEDGSEVEKLILTKTNSCDTADTLFSVHEATTTNNKYLETSKAVQISGNGIWIRRGDIVEDDDSFSFIVRGSRDKSAAVSLIINTYSKVNENGHQSDADSSSASIKEPLDVFTGTAIRRHIQKYKEMTVVPRSDSVNTVWPNSIRTDMPFFNFVMDKSIYFSQGFPISATNVQLGVDKGNATVRPHRQNLLREQGSLEVVLQIVQTLIPVTDRSEIIKANSGNRKKKQPSDDEVAMISMGMAILKKCFELIYYNILDNSENQLYVADYMPVLLSHLNTQPLAGKCVTEMLSKNMELQETKIKASDIQIFVEKLRSSKMNAMYLNLLQACCSCEGDGVDANQGKIATMIFSNTNDVIIQLNADYKKVSMVPWNQENSIYLTARPIPGSPICGEPLISKGIPLLSLNWTTNSIDYSPLGLFGKLSVNVEELFKIVSGGDDLLKKSAASGSKLLKSKKIAAATQKAAVATYFVSQMFLGAEMCLDRNYIAMHCLDDLFPYEVLITILKLNVRSDLKSAAARLMMTLHVDRDPQAKSKIPCLTRTWSDVKKNSDPQLPFVDPGRRYYFGLLQQLISEYVQQMAGSKWDELSEHMLKLLKTLVEFNFYGEISRMENVVAPLIMALDRRQVVYVDLVTASISTQKKGKEKDTDGSPEKVLENVSNEEKLQDSEMPDALSNDTIEKVRGNWYDPLVDGFFSFLEIFNINNAAKVLLLEDSTDGSGIYSPPIRYSKAPLFELETMVLIVDILGFSQHVIEDRDISVLMRYFYLWDSGLDNRSPAELFEQSIIDSKTLTLGVAYFDNVMIDVLMFVHTPLVQSTLEVLMAHHSKRSILLKNMKGVQLLASNKKERQFKMVDQMLQQLEQNAETQELWGELANEADYAVSKQTKDILTELTDLLRIPNFELDFDYNFSPNVPVQDLLRNLGCFDICLKVVGLLETIEEELDEKALNTQEVCRLCNDLLYWFFLKNPKNQELGFDELDQFLDTLDDDINSHLVVGAIFCDNEQLMVQIPRKHIVNMVDLIVKNGQSHHYLSLLLALPTIGEKNITENQIDIVMNLTSPGKFQKVVSYFVPVHSPEYEQKCELMEPYLEETKDINIEDLPPLLSYHLVLLHVLSRCTVGRLNVTAVEAKVQSIFLYKDILNAILDNRSNLLTKLYMSDFFFNAVMDVELSIPGLEISDSMWTLLSSYTSILVNAPADLQIAHELGWQSPEVCSQKIKLYIVCIRIIGAFFKTYYDPTQFKDTASTSKNKDQTSFVKSDVDKIITDLYDLVIEVHKLNSPRLGKEIKSYIVQAAEHLKKSSPRLKEATIPLLEASADSNHSPESKIDEHEEKIANKFQTFLKEIEKDALVQYKADNEGVAFISLLEKLPFIADPVDADVRYEGLIKKLVFHIRENIKIVDNRKQMDPRITATSRWIVKAFRTMIENRMGMSIHERDDYGGEVQDNAAAPVVNALNTCGATALCLDLIAFGIDESLQLEAIKLGVGLLFKEGGALEVQTLMNSHLRNSNSELFFKQVRLTVQKLQAWSSWNKVIILEDGAEPSPPDELLLLRFLQLMCEGHYLPNQDILREQSHNAISYNLLDDFVSYLNCLSRIPCRTSTVAGIRLTALILEVIQGPCEGNQVHFALNTELVEALNRINRSKVIVPDCVEEEEIEMKKISIDIFQGLIEGQGEKSPLYDRILSIIHLDIIVMMSKNPSYCSVDENSVPTEEQLILQTECVVLLLSFCNFRPSLYDEIGISRRVEDIVGSGTAMIEVIWRSGIHRRFFHVPAVCDYLAKSSKDNLVENVDRSTAENKLVDFLNRSHDLYREVKHQQLLTEMNIASVFSRANIDRLTWVSFILVCTINGFFIGDYNVHDPSSTPQISGWVKAVTFYLKIVLAVVSFLTILLWVVVRSPVIYQSYIAAKYSIYESIIYSAIDGMTAYYVWFLVVSILAVVLADYYMSVLLLDIVVKDATTRAVLRAVVTPWKALAMGALLQAFVIYIYSFFTVSTQLCNQIVSLVMISQLIDFP